ncbi:hypothetical protein BDW22DRAFT_1359663 [Trametopsis cervina]|nr:hypothetical protein BDW22DRAFT_1359663 [Trametopsis cervina]
MSTTHLLLQYGSEPWAVRFTDLENRLAFTVYVPLTCASIFRWDPVLKYVSSYPGLRYFTDNSQFTTTALNQSSQVEELPNLLLKLVREAPWAQQHPDIMGPVSSFFYFGPSRTPGNLAYGNTSTHPMANDIRPSKRDSNTRYFLTQSGKEYKWKVSPTRYECYDHKNVQVAVWEVVQGGESFNARLTLKQAALPVVTEIVTTLTLNRISQVLNW